MKLERIFTLLTAIDFSGNKLRGKIPQSIGMLKDLIVLNMSSNGFTGNIPSSLANLTQLESLDLSHNKLSGHIPPTLGDLTSLSNITVHTTSSSVQYHNAHSFKHKMLGLLKKTLDYVVFLLVKVVETLTWSNHKSKNQRKKKK